MPKGLKVLKSMKDMYKNPFNWLILTIALLALLLGCKASTESIYTWQEEFDYEGLPDSSKWTYDVGGNGWGNKELQYYTDTRIENAFVSDGTLKIQVIRENIEGMQYSSARLVSRGRYDFGYGRIDIRARVPEGKGTWPALWMMPKDWKFEDGGWPTVGEIDIMEHVGFEPGVIHGSTHSEDFQWQKGNPKTAKIEVPTATSEFHVYSMERTADYIRMYVDNELYFEFLNEDLPLSSWPFNKPFYLIINVAVGGLWGGQQGVDDTAFPQILEVDYIRFQAF